MKRQDLTIGQKVLVVPVHSNKDLPEPKPFPMYVQELKEGKFAGLSHRRVETQHVYGILYEIIHPIN